MKIYIAVLLSLIIMGCSNDFELNEAKKETPVVYGVLDPAFENQFIRVERSFVDKERSALEIAQIVDSLYYPDITVTLTNGSLSVVGEKVDGADFGLPRESGAFASVPNTLYRFDTEALELEVGDVIDLSIAGIFEDRAITSSATIIAEPGVSDPNKDGGTEFNFLLDRDRRFTWSGREGNVQYDLELEMFVTEVSKTAGTDPVENSAIWSLAKGTTENVVAVAGEDFYRFMGTAFEADDDLLRFFGDMTYRLTAGDATLETINRISSSNLGITASGEIPSFTNMSEGLGIFAAKSSVIIPNVQLAGTSKQLLKTSEFTSDLNFQ